MIENKGKQELRIKLIICREEREFYSDILTRKHYLKNSMVNKNTIMHVLSRGREDVAVLTWERQRVKHFKLRDKLIGWSKEGKSQRVKHCIQNRRFLVLKPESNLASQSISKSVKRICADALEHYGHEVLLAETFVDPSQGNSGTCYQAAGWQEVGLTVGGKGEDKRNPKLYFVKELHQQAIHKLKSPKLTTTDLSNPRQQELFLDKINFVTLRSKLEQIPDYRQRRGKNDLTAMLLLITAGILSGCSNVKAISRWVDYLTMETIKNFGCRRRPSYSTLRRVLINVDYEKLSKCLCSWLEEQGNKIPINKQLKILIFDGKAMKTASKFSEDLDFRILNVIDAVTCTLKAQLAVTNKENEIPVAQNILSNIELDADTIVLADALHTQKKTANLILKKTPITSSL